MITSAKNYTQKKNNRKKLKKQKQWTDRLLDKW